MKSIPKSSICLMVCFLFLNCNSEGGAFKEVPARSKGIFGIWQLEATKISPGGIVDWTKVESKNRFVFKSDKTFSYSADKNEDYNKAGTFVVNQGKLTLNYSQDGSERSNTFFLSYKDGKMILEYEGCIEECKERYQRID